MHVQADKVAQPMNKIISVTRIFDHFARGVHLPENPLRKMVEAVFPVGWVVRVAIHVPYVRDILFFEVSMHSLADADQPILVAARKPEQFQLLFGRCRIRNEFRRGLRVGSGRKTADPGELVEMRHPEVQRLSATHGKPGQGTMLTVILNRVA